VNLKNVESKIITPMLFPFEPEEFWVRIRVIIKEEIEKAEKSMPAAVNYQTPDLAYKPLYKITEVCSIFKVSRPTIYDWIKHGKLKPYKVRSRLYFLWNDIHALIKA
jgi:excisionase family DNA binding protein